ncbi:hypothetical protein [Streptomyces sp. RTGN2]|uniref:hypothetical protein n=1 Tax=Streptomyces sp. RTGN2 TaxID=3016525 RepID=UPI002552CAD6|nr:hypothetical protein [Streptomyces sp. RTGN2]
MMEPQCCSGSPRGIRSWTGLKISRPGRTHGITAARRDRLRAHLRAAGLGILTDLYFLRLDDDPDRNAANRRPDLSPARRPESLIASTSSRTGLTPSQESQH